MTTFSKGVLIIIELEATKQHRQRREISLLTFKTSIITFNVVAILSSCTSGTRGAENSLRDIFNRIKPLHSFIKSRYVAKGCLNIVCLHLSSKMAPLFVSSQPQMHFLSGEGKRTVALYRWFIYKLSKCPVDRLRTCTLDKNTNTVSELKYFASILPWESHGK